MSTYGRQSIVLLDAVDVDFYMRGYLACLLPVSVSYWE